MLATIFAPLFTTFLAPTLVLIGSVSSAGVPIAAPAVGGIRVEKADDLVLPTSPSPDYESSTEAWQDLHFTYCEANETSALERELEVALAALFRGDVDVALPSLVELSGASSSDIAGLAGGVLANVYFNQGRYDDVARLYGPNPGAFMNAVLALPEERRTFVPEPISNRLVVGPSGTPMVETSVNGELVEMWFDTGAAFTSLSRSMAERLGADFLEGHKASIGTSTSRTVVADFATLRTMQVGQMLVEEHPVFVFEDEDLSFSTPGGSIEIEAILGWNAIRHGRVVLDHGGGSYSFEASVRGADSRRNFAWLGCPLVRMHAANGRELLFGLDTGSKVTFICDPIFEKISFGDIRQTMATIGGAGGSEVIPSQIIDHLELILSGHRVSLPNVRKEPPGTAFFVNMDGTLGSDMAQGMVLTLDFQNGHYDLRSSDDRE